ncbi:hypothetical protein FB446DRAFT_725534 [Lentinula raphanica]|nr:hypothetical protein FB446DRAFT_725534 [Lentinula raphanica]
MSTASTSYTLDDAISKLKFGLSTRLEEKSERILNDDEILGLEKILYKLDRELATTKSKERQMASRYIAFNKQLTGFREMFTRYRHAREAYSMAKTYESNIRREAADAQMRAMREKYSRKQQRKQEQLREDRTRTRSTEATLTISTSDRISPELIQLMGTLKKPAILCPVCFSSYLRLFARLQWKSVSDRQNPPYTQRFQTCISHLLRERHYHHCQLSCKYLFISILKSELKLTTYWNLTCRLSSRRFRTNITILLATLARRLCPPIPMKVWTS